MRVFEKRVHRRIFGLMREEVTGGWRNFHIEELHNLYSSPNVMVIRSKRMRNAYKNVVGKPEGTT
jgi:hypothetical protein